jgi:hypothetical protein
LEELEGVRDTLISLLATPIKSRTIAGQMIKVFSEIEEAIEQLADKEIGV